jgi:hypothetical protein
MENEKVIVLNKISFGLSLLLLFYWLCSNVINIYNYAIIGAFYELFWLPMLALLFVLPVLNSYLFIKTENSKLNYLNLLLNIITTVRVALM